MADGIGRMDALADALLLENMHIIKRIFRTNGNLSHRLHRLQRIFAAGSFAAQHNNVAAVKNRVGNVTGLGTGCTVAVNHTFQHLRSRDNRLTRLIAACNNILLHQRYILGRYLYAQVTSGNHYTVGYADNLIDMLHTGLVLDFGNNPDRRACFLKHFTDSDNIIGLLHEGCRNIIHIMLDSKKNICLVLLRQKRQLQLNTGAGHTLSRAKLTAVDHLGINSAAVNAYNL